MFYAKDTLTELRLNVRWSRTLERIIGQVWRESARQWLRWFISEVPVQTGMARGAFQPLGRFLNVAIPIEPKRKPYHSKLYNAIQQPSLGAGMTTFVFVDENTNPGSLFFEFQWTTDVLHYFLAEYYNGSARAADEVVQEAQEVFFDILTTTISRRVANELSPTYVPLILASLEQEADRG